MAIDADFVIRNAAELATCASPGGPKRGPAQADAGVVPGGTVAARDGVIVAVGPDAEVMPKPPWRERKERYIAHVRKTSPSVRLVSMCDKLHNARSLIMDLRGKRADLWSRFSAGRDETCWYYRQLIAAFRDALSNDPPTSLRMGELLEELVATVDALERESAQ